MVQTLVCKEHGVFNEDGARPQDEGGEEVDVDVVSRAPKLSANPDEPAQWRKIVVMSYYKHTLSYSLTAAW